MNTVNTDALAKAVSGYRFPLWRIDGPPPLTINPQADTHALLAWCHGEAQQLHELCRMHLGDDDNTAGDLAGVTLGHINGLVAVLEHLAKQSLKKGTAA